MPSSHRACCVVNCDNTWRNSQVKFYHFPVSYKKIDQRTKWITAVRRVNSDGTEWTPNKYAVICSEHFVGGVKSEKPLDPNYVPTLFPAIYRKQGNLTLMQERFERNSARNEKKISANNGVHEHEFSIGCAQRFENLDFTINSDESVHEETGVACQCDFPIDRQSKTIPDSLMCHMYTILSEDKVVECHVAVQTNISPPDSLCAEIQTQTDLSLLDKLKYPVSQKKIKDQSSQTSIQYKDSSVQTDIDSICCKHFTGYDSIRSDEELVDLVGVTKDVFLVLLKRMPQKKRLTISMENRLFVLLMKMKLGISYSAIGALFRVHRTTISTIFLENLRHLAAATRDFVPWPSKLAVLHTMPNCFKPQFEKTRVILDCTEFRIEVPNRVDNRVYCYSNYKKGFTAKVLIGITPGGLISWKSKAYGGRKSDSQITIDSGILDKLETDDVILADKGFPEISSQMSKSGKRTFIVMPPFLEKKDAFTKEETEKTYKIAKVRIHVERVMQRLRLHRILDKVPKSLFHVIDDIVHVCCVLVNMQQPILADDGEDEIGDE